MFRWFQGGSLAAALAVVVATGCASSHSAKRSDSNPPATLTTTPTGHTASAPSFAGLQSYPTGRYPNIGPRSVAIGDLNGDGDPDLATANSAGTVSVLLNSGERSFWESAATEPGAGLPRSRSTT